MILLKFHLTKESINSNAREIFNSIINDLEKTKKDFTKIKKAFGDDGLKIDKKTLMLDNRKRKFSNQIH